MSIAIVVILSVIIASIGYVRGYRSTIEPKSSKTGWFGLCLLALLAAGLWASGRAGNEPAAYGFGFALVLAFAFMLLVGVASAIGRAMRNRKDQTE